MKTLFTLLLGFCIPVARGQDMKAIEQHLLDGLEKISYWSGYDGTDPHIDKVDSLEKANKVFKQMLLKYTSTYPATINFNFKRMEKSELVIATSEDGRFRIYSWDTWLGGTMHIFDNVYQYNAGGKVFSKAIKNPVDGDPGCWYSKIYSLIDSGRTYYLGVNHAIFSTAVCYQEVNIFRITGHVLDNRVKLIKTKTGIRNSVGFEFNISSVVDDGDWPVDLIKYDPAAKSFRFPVVLGDGTDDGMVTRKSIVYRFTGHYFERVK